MRLDYHISKRCLSDSNNQNKDYKTKCKVILMNLFPRIPHFLQSIVTRFIVNNRFELIVSWQAGRQPGSKLKVNGVIKELHAKVG